MALINIRCRDFSDDRNVFYKLYECSFEEFIKAYSYNDDIIEIDLKNKIVIALNAEDDRNFPVCINSIFIPEQEKKKYSSRLIYAGHIAFIIVEFENGGKTILYKDDECYPQNFEDCLNSGDILFCANEKGFDKQDILNQIEKTIQCTYDYNFKLEEQQLIILEGL